MTTHRPHHAARRSCRGRGPGAYPDAPSARKATHMGGHLDTPGWSRIPAPADDGGARHLPGARVASVPLPATDGAVVDLSALPGRAVVYAYPRTGPPSGGN